MDDFLPGSGNMTDPPYIAPTIEELHATLSEPVDVAERIRSSTINNLVDPLHSAKTVYDSIGNRMLGDLGNILDGPSAVSNRLRDKYATATASKLGEVFELLAPIGVVPPGRDALDYMQQTGDYIGGFSGSTDYRGGSGGAEKPGYGYSKPGTPGTPVAPIPPTIPPPTGSPGTQPPPTGIERPIGGGTQPPNFTPSPPPAPSPIGGTPITNPLPPPGSIDYGDSACKDFAAPFVEGMQCQEGWYLDILPGNLATCRNIDTGRCMLPTLPPPNQDGGYEPVTQPPEVEPQPQPPPGPPPVQLDTATCTYPRRPTVKTGEGCIGPPGPPPVAGWIKTKCDGCNICYEIYMGDDPPPVAEGESLYGPFTGTIPDPAQYLRQQICVKLEPGEEEGTPPEEEEEPEEEIPEEELPPEDEDEPVEEPPPQPPQEQPPQPFPQVPPQHGGGKDPCDNINNIVGLASDSGEWLNQLKNDLFGELYNPTGIIGRLLGSNPLVKFAATFVDKLFIDFQKLLQDYADKTDCDAATVLPIWLYQATVNFLNKFSGLLPQQVVHAINQASNTACQSQLPGTASADMAYLRGTADFEDWKCWHKAAGSHLSPAFKVMNAGRAKLDPAQLNWLFRRKYIDPQTYARLSREAGVLKQEDLENIHSANDQWPSMSDTIRLMVRDVADEQNIDWSKSDESFEAKYQGKVKDFFDAVGIPKETAKLFWRAHWHIPSFTMLTEMFHRSNGDQFSEDLKVGVTDIINALQQDDWHPNWVMRMVAMSYKQVTRTDAIGAYTVEAIDDEQFIKYLRALGYKEDDAFTYLEYFRTKRRITNLRRIGYPTGRQIVNAYARCELPESDFRFAISKIAFTPNQETEAREGANLSRKMWSLKQAITSVRRPYLKGLLDDGTAIQMLQDRGVDPDCIDSFIRDWSLQRLRGDRFLSAGQLCKMRERGIVTAEEQLRALVRTGWTAEDALRIVLECGIEIDEKARRRAETLARRQAAELKRIQKEQEKANRERECGPKQCPANTPGGRFQRQTARLPNQTEAGSTVANGQTNLSAPENPESKL